MAINISRLVADTTVTCDRKSWHASWIDHPSLIGRLPTKPDYSTRAVLELAGQRVFFIQASIIEREILYGVQEKGQYRPSCLDSHLLSEALSPFSTSRLRIQSTAAMVQTCRSAAVG